MTVHRWFQEQTQNAQAALRRRTQKDAENCNSHSPQEPGCQELLYGNDLGTHEPPEVVPKEFRPLAEAYAVIGGDSRLSLLFSASFCVRA